MTETLLADMHDAIETELQRQIARLDGAHTGPFLEMLTYHMGWTGEGAGPAATGKRIRPLLVLLTHASAGGDWRKALPAAAAVELVHNFSLVHDDIQDNSDKRRGRATVWSKWGAPMAINVGDGLFALANLAILDLKQNYPADQVVKAAEILHQTCLQLTVGQFMDMSFEDRDDVKVDEYWAMIGGKTAALLAACCHLGAVLAGVDEPVEEAYRSFGNYLGIAFQVQDDILGIWGNEAITGKSAASDLTEGKKTLPVLVGLNKKGKFAARWAHGSIGRDDVEEVAKLLAAESAYEYTHEAGKQMTDMALNSLREADPQGEAGDALTDLAFKLLKREA